MATTSGVRFGGKLVIEGDLTVGDLVAFMLYTTQIGASIGMMSGLVGSFFVAQGASKRSFQLIDREPKVCVSWLTVRGCSMWWCCVPTGVATSLL